MTFTEAGDLLRAAGYRVAYPHRPMRNGICIEGEARDEDGIDHVVWFDLDAKAPETFTDNHGRGHDQIAQMLSDAKGAKGCS